MYVYMYACKPSNIAMYVRACVKECMTSSTLMGV